MDHVEREAAQPLKPPKGVAGDWYLKGFSDAYHARPAVIPSGPAGEQYQKGYAQGQMAVQRVFLKHLGIS